eukprot:m.157606 g.157606  ORF g.157606 m.157606 type:complete len:53 (+) comp16311_c3_seq1:4004-4162(+)
MYCIQMLAYSKAETDMKPLSPFQAQVSHTYRPDRSKPKMNASASSRLLFPCC